MLASYQPQGAAETADLERIRALADGPADPWLRSTALHLTASALVLHPPDGQVLLRWHQRQQAWLQVGGHADPGETDALAVALLEAVEETGLADLEPWPDAGIRHVVIVDVPASATEPAHQHADIRFGLATSTPEAARAESPDAPVRWLSPQAARELTAEDNLSETLTRVEHLLGR
jgi:8-oxo-dGTP pyrophosphatase MutT (NUDIX family)